MGVLEEDAERPDTWVDAGSVEAGRPIEVALGRSLPIGYHRLVVESGGTCDDGLVVAAPLRAPERGAHGWGIFAPVHALRSRGDWGVGSVRELGELRSWLRDRGGTVLATLPMLAQFLDDPLFEPGPYSPASRLFWNELYLDVERAPELARCPEARELIGSPEYRRLIGRARAGDHVDHRLVYSLKRRALEKLTPEWEGQPTLDSLLSDYSRFRERTEGARGSSSASMYHEYVQWLTGVRIGLDPEKVGPERAVVVVAHLVFEFERAVPLRLRQLQRQEPLGELVVPRHAG